MESQSKHSFCIIIPMYNEEKNAEKCIDKVMDELKSIPYKNTLIIVDDGSTDNTREILTNKQKEYKTKLVYLHFKRNKGYGGALQAGINYALENKYEFYITMDSDLTNPPKDIHTFIKYIPKNFDCIKASRYIKGGKMINVPLFRQVISRIGNKIALTLFGVGIHDCTNGFKMVRLSFLKGIRFKERNTSIILEELYYLKKRHARFAEIPNVLYSRSNSKSHFRYRPKIFYDFGKYALKSFFV